MFNYKMRIYLPQPRIRLKLGIIRGEAFYHKTHQSNPLKSNLEHQEKERKEKD